MASRLLAGRYELIEKIGEGGMAVVYKARCRLLNRFVAIKILKPEFTKDSKIIESFRRESQAAASLSHPNIVNIYDVGREGNIYYIVMELIEGHILNDLIKENGALEWKRAVEIAKQICAALSVAHKNNIIHRDVKPHNILITNDGTAKITDFGIAKAIDEAGSVNEKTETIMGSVHYFSPEQARGGYIDEKSDIYSLGIVLYEMLTGQVPFDGDNPVAVALKHINEEMRPPRSINPDIPESLEEVVMKATDKYQVNRYASADEMLRALENVEFSEMLGKKKKEEKEAAALKKAQAQEKEAEDKEAKDKKKMSDKKMKIMAVVLALVLAIPLSFGIVKVSGYLFSGSGKAFKTPDFRGMTLEEAEDVAKEKGLKIKAGDKVYSYDYDEGEISSQRPEADSKVKKGKTITVNISKGMKEGTVPKIEGLSYDNAVHILEKYNFRVGSVTTEASDMPKDFVISQKPAPGEEATPGASISFVISEGMKEGTVKVPMLVGKNVDDAKDMIEKAGFKLGEVVYEKNPSCKKNEVFWQEYPEGETLDKDTSISIRVSSGDEEVSNAVPLYIDYSMAEDSVFWLTVTVSDENGQRNLITREQRVKENGGENIEITGSGKGSVTVIFNNDVVIKHDVDFNSGKIL